MAKKSGFSQFLDDNTKGVAAKAFLGLSVAEIAQSDNKLKALLKTLGSLLLMRPLIAIGLAGAFSAMGKSIRSLLADTGSLQAALRKLAQIQGLQRMFAPLVGGAEAAKTKVAALVNFAASNNLDLGDVGAVTRNLESLTHGAYSGAAALQTIGDTAAATGNGLRDTGGAVAEVYAGLREGRPIAEAAEKLRQMGIVSDITVNELTALQQSGADAAAVFAALTKSLEAYKGAMRGLAGDMASVNAAYDAAKSNLGEKFASPFVASDIENTRNMTDAMNAIAPSVGRIAGFLEKLTNGFSTVNSWLAKTAAQSPILTSTLEAGVVVLSSLIAVVSAVAGLSLGAWLLGAAGAATTAATSLIAFTGATGAVATAIGALGVAVRVAMIGTGILAIVAVLATAVGIYENFATSSDRAAKALEDQAKAHNQVADAMAKQISAARTLREHQEALAKSISNTKDAQKEYADAMAAQADTDTSFTASRADKERAYQRAESARANLIATKQTEKAERDRVTELQKRGILSPDRARQNIAVAEARARLANNNEGAVRLSNLGQFGGEYERLRGMYGDAGAKDRALALTSAQIAEQGAAPAAASLAKIGLGGEFGGGTDVQKQIRDLTKDVAGYLRSIDAKMTGDGTPANTPQEYDGT